MAGLVFLCCLPRFIYIVDLFVNLLKLEAAPWPACGVKHNMAVISWVLGRGAAHRSSSHQDSSD